jgi:hypothetical protein
LKGQTLEGVTIEDVTDGVGKNGSKDKFINFKLIGSENGKAVKIGVAVIQSSVRTVLAGLERLTNYKKFDLTRGCLVRSKSPEKKINRNSQSYKLLNALTSRMGGEFVELMEEQIKPLVAVLSVYQKRENYSLSEEQIFDFISQKHLTFENPLLREILSDPSGQIPDGAVEDDIKLIATFLNSSNIDDRDESDELSDFDLLS